MLRETREPPAGVGEAKRADGLGTRPAGASRRGFLGSTGLAAMGAMIGGDNAVFQHVGRASGRVRTRGAPAPAAPLRPPPRARNT